MYSPYTMNMATTDGKGFNGVNFYHGNYIIGPQNQVEVIASQGPLDNTVDDFWKIVIINNVYTVIGILIKFQAYVKSNI